MSLYFVNVGLVVAVVGNKDVSTRGRYAARITRGNDNSEALATSSVHFYRMEFGCGDCPHFPVELKAANERSLTGGQSDFPQLDRLEDPVEIA